MRARLRDARTVVVKIGTSSLLDERGLLDLPVVTRHLRDLVALERRGIRGILVSSGAIGVGSVKLGYAERPTTMPELQATAAVGQSLLMNTYNTLLAQESWMVAQLLVTHDDFQDRRRYLNLRNTLAALHGKPVLPVFNENDSVSVDEIRFGDNDTLAALVAGLVGADVTVLFTDVDGFHLDGGKLDTVSEITPAMEQAAGPGRGSGGMRSKLGAVSAITRAGGAALIAHGKHHGIAEILRGDPIGTMFAPRGTLDPRSRWLHALKDEGRVHVDAGTVSAIRDGGRSLLPVGVVSCEGEFDAGAAVLVLGPGGAIAKGLANYGAADLRRILGRRSGEIEPILGIREFDEVIHRDNLVVL